MGPFTYYVSQFLSFLTPPPVSIRNFKWSFNITQSKHFVSFSDQPPSAAYVICERSHITQKNFFDVSGISKWSNYFIKKRNFIQIFETFLFVEQTISFWIG